MKPVYIFLLIGALLYTGCGKDKVKPSADYLLSQELVKKIDTIKSAYVSKSKSNLRILIDPPLSENIINTLSFNKADLAFNQRLVRIGPDYVNVSISWQGSWWNQDDKEFNNRGVTDLIFQRETMKLSRITGDNPFVPPYERYPGQAEITGMDSSPESTITSEKNVTAQPQPAKADEEHSVAATQLDQDNGNKPETHITKDVTTHSVPIEADEEHSVAATQLDQDMEEKPETHSTRDVTTQFLPTKADKEHSVEVKPMKQDRKDHSKYYSIQTGSFLAIENARLQFDLITVLLEKEDYDNLRIEKISDFYTVRLGKYDNYFSAADLLQKLIHKIESAIIVKAPILENRIMKPRSTQSQ